MKLFWSFLLNTYWHLYSFLAKKRLQQKDLDPRSIHGLTVAVIFTSPLMWSYALLAYYQMASPIPGLVGFACAGVHLLGPLLFKITNNSYLLGNIILSAGLTHQATFSYFSGGLMSDTLKWFAILPLLAGVISGRKGALTWGLVSLLTSAMFLIADQNGHQFPYLISSKGSFYANALLQFGFILVSATVISIAVTLQENAEIILHEQRKKIDDLFKVLFHDLANPLGRMGIGLNILKKQSNEPQSERGIQIISQATDSMLEITQNVRTMYALSKGKTGVDLVPTSLNEAMTYLHQLFTDDLQKKNLKLVYHFEKHNDLTLIVEPISFKNQVLANIISNAIKFSHPGGSIHIEAKNLNDSIYELEIRDEGMGIPEELLPHLFDVNKTINRQGTGGEKGSGFGLQIMKSFVEFYGGEISIKSAEQKGTTFSIKLKGMKNTAKKGAPKGPHSISV